MSDSCRSSLPACHGDSGGSASKVSKLVVTSLVRAGGDMRSSHPHHHFATIARAVMSAARIPRLLVPTKLSNFRLIPSASSATRRWASAAAAAPPPTSAKAKRQGKTSGVSTGGSSGGSGIKRVHGVRVYDHLPPGWNMRIGIETHAQIKTREKLFSPATLKPFRPPVAPSTTIAPFDAALPGTLPRINPVAVELALRACLALECNVAPEARFDRKHYFYRDLPSGYQITMKYSAFIYPHYLCIHD